MNHTKISLAIAEVLILLLGLVVISEYLQQIKAEAKTYSLSTSMSTSCNGDTDEPCQTVVCNNDKPCRPSESNSAQTDMRTTCKNDQSCRSISPNSTQDEDNNSDMSAPLEAP